MNNHKIRVRLIPTNAKLTTQADSANTLNTKKSFWEFISREIDEEKDNPEKLEYKFQQRFPGLLKDRFRDKIRQEIREFERNYHSAPPFFIDDWIHLEKYFSRNAERDQSEGIVSGMAKIQEAKNNYFQNNPKYQEALNKSLLATQIEFAIDNIQYSSLGFDLIFEPFEKAADLFDNNYELFRIFLDQYIPTCFVSSIALSAVRIPIETSISVSSEFIDEFQNRQMEPNQNPEIIENPPKSPSKLDKAKWAWVLTNTSLVVPVILALLVLYFSFGRLESIEESRKDAYDEINVERNKLLKNYQELINLQKDSYKTLINEIKQDTTK